MAGETNPLIDLLLSTIVSSTSSMKFIGYNQQGASDALNIYIPF